jgi:hypothetical protein
MMSTVILRECAIVACTGGGSGAFHIAWSAAAEFIDCSAVACTASVSDSGFLAAADNASVTLTRSVISGCQAKAKGGGLSCSLSALTFNDCTIRQCRAETGGGLAIFGMESYVRLGGTSITHCGATANGGGAAIRAGVLLLMFETDIHANVAPIGGNIDAQGGAVTYVLPTPPGMWVPASTCKVRQCTSYAVALLCPQVHAHLQAGMQSD